MKLFFLLFTPAEPGAPGYLSRRGEESASGLAESLHAFLTGSLGIALDAGFASRARSLEEDVRWRLFRKSDQIPQAVQASLALEPRVLLVSGAQERTMNTARALAGRLALPVCVDERADGHSGEKKPVGVLADTIDAITAGAWLSASEPPKAVLVGTSREALEEWAGLHFLHDKRMQLKDVLDRTTQGGVFPSVFACGYESSVMGEAGHWLFD